MQIRVNRVSIAANVNIRGYHPISVSPVTFADRASIKATTSSIDQSRSAIPAAIAGVTPVRRNLVVRSCQGQERAQEHAGWLSDHRRLLDLDGDRCRQQV